MVAESLRVGGGIRNDKPIFPYAWHYYHSGEVLQTVNTSIQVLETVFQSGGDGIVFWGGAMNDTYWQWLQNQYPTRHLDQNTQQLMATKLFHYHLTNISLPQI